MKPEKSHPRLNPECIPCIINKQIGCYPKKVSKNSAIEYMQRILKVIADAPDTTSAPEIIHEIYAIQKELFGYIQDYSDIKRHFNKLMLDLEPEILSAIHHAPDTLKAAVQYAMMGNYIDFAAMENVDEQKLREFLDTAQSTPLDTDTFENLKKDLSEAKTLVYLTDNCGEIVLDKLLISVIRKQYPGIDIAVIVRGAPAINDATVEDAIQTGLADLIPVIGNGSDIAGTCLDKLSNEARERIDTADVLIAKGQANYETLQKSGKNIFYIFMCKCKLFAERFGVPLYQGILANEKLSGKGAYDEL